MLHDFNLTKLVLLSILILRIQMPVILSLFNTRDLHFRYGAHTQSNW